jgi:hypothetical protein
MIVQRLGRSEVYRGVGLGAAPQEERPAMAKKKATKKKVERLMKVKAPKDLCSLCIDGEDVKIPANGTIEVDRAMAHRLVQEHGFITEASAKAQAK